MQSAPEPGNPQIQSSFRRTISSWSADIRRYGTMLQTFHRDSWAAGAVYRADFVAATLVSLFWLASGVIGLLIFYQFVDSIAGWTLRGALVNLGLYFCMNGYRMLLIRPCLVQLSEQVRTGTFDYVLLRPASSQFLVCFRRFNPASWWDLFWGLILVGAGMLHNPISFGAATAFLVCFLMGLAILHAAGVLVMAAAIRIIRTDSLDDLMRGVLEIGQYPVDFYGPTVSRLLTAVPIAFLTTVPARALLGQSGWIEPMAALASAVLVVTLSSLAWRRAIAGYSGASS